jgi:HEAT repeat protein
MSRTIVQFAALTLLATILGCQGIETSAEPTVPSRQAYVDARTALLQETVSADPFTRTHALEAISQTLGTEAAGYLVKGLSDRSPAVQYAAAMGLGDIAYKEAEPRLLAIVENVRADARVVCGALYALHEIGNDTYTTQLGSLLFNENPEVRACAVRSMGKMGNSAAIDPLRSLLAEERKPDVKLEIIIALSRLGERKFARMLESFAMGPYLDMRLVAIPELATMNAPNAERTLRKYTGSGHPPRVRVAAAGALGLLGRADASDYNLCRNALQNPAGMLRGFFGAEYDLADKDVYSLQQLAARSLGQMDSRSALDILHRHLQSPDGAVRVMSAKSILEILDRPARLPDIPEQGTESVDPSIPDGPGMETSGGID